MSGCTHPAHQHCSFCDSKGRLTVEVDGNGDPHIDDPAPKDPSRRGLLKVSLTGTMEPPVIGI